MIKLFRVNIDKCEGCGKCVKVCEQGVFEMSEEEGKIVSYMVHPEKCDNCGKCFVSCSQDGVPIELRNSDETPFEKVVSINKDNCDACEMCIVVCPRKNYEIVEEEGKIFAKIKNPDECLCDGHCCFTCKAEVKPQIYKKETILN